MTVASQTADRKITMALNGDSEGCWRCELSILARIQHLLALALVVPQLNVRGVIAALEVPN